MKCPYCENELPDHSKYCSFCGNEINESKKICPECHHEESIDTLYCSHCGYQFQKENSIELSRINNKKQKQKKPLIIVAIIAMLLVIGCLCYFLFFKEDHKKSEKKEKKITEKLVLEEDQFELEVGQREYIEANVDCIYQVKDEKIVEVDSFGTITAKSPGKTTITVKTKQGNNAKCTVVVKEAPNKIEIESYQASSTLVASGYNYSVKNLHDQNKLTCWSEGVEGDGIGEKITVSFKNTVSIDQLQLMNGISKNQNLYNKNNRLKKISLIFDDGSSESIEIKDIYNEYQTISFTKHQTKNIVIQIDEVYKGTTYQDTCLTELTFLSQSE